MHSLNSLSLTDFGDALSKVVFPSQAVRSEQFLKGREAQLRGIQEAAFSPGRQVFIHGLTGVGKTSLALTAAYTLQSSDAEPIYISCDEDSTVYSTIRTIAEIGKGIRPNMLSSGQTIGASGSGFLMQADEQDGRFPVPTNIPETIQALQSAIPGYSRNPIIIIDEVNKFPESEKVRVSELIRGLSEAQLPGKVIFCGTGDTLDELLETDRQTYRFLHAVELIRLNFSSLRDILESALENFSVQTDDTTAWRICRISDGFPNFVHLLAEKCLWALYRSIHKQPIMSETTLTPSHFIEGVKGAIGSVEQELVHDYDKSVKKYDANSHIILAAVADHHELERQIAHIFESYRRICSNNNILNILSETQFRSRVYNLCKSDYGEILRKGTNKGYYQFSKHRMRGYARLRAQERGIDLFPDHPLG